MPGRTLPEVWARRWAARPDAAVLVDGSGSVSVSGSELDQRTAGAASVLAERGVGRGDRVLWRAPATLESVVALVAVLRAGGVLVPVSTAAPGAEVAHIVADAGPVLALGQESERGDLTGLGVPVMSVDDLTRAGPRAGGPPELHPGDDALIVYTSGTTGKPKGAVHTHGSLVAGHRLDHCRLGVGSR